MSSNVVFNGTTYAIPADGDFGWGAQLTAFFIDIAGASFQKTGGAFTLTAEADFGATYGLKSAYFKSRAANPAAAGAIRLGNTETISWRNAANGADKALTVSASDVLTYGGTKVILSGAIVNADVDAAAAIAYSKLNLSGSIVNADVSASAAIAYSKLDLSDSLVNADINSAAAIAYSKLNLSGEILNADINASAAIALSKLAAVTASRVLISDGSGFVSASSVTATTLGYLDATSSIQTQINGKEASITTLSIAKGGTNNGSLSVAGGVIPYGDGSKLVGLANGSANQYLKSNGGTAAPSWATFTTPTVQKLTTGTGATYTTPAGVKWIEVELRGGGGGGSGSGTASSSSNGSAGGTVTFGTSLISATGGAGGVWAGAGGDGGTASVSSPALEKVKRSGQKGGGGQWQNITTISLNGGVGGGGAGQGVSGGVAGSAAAAQSGGGGAGAGNAAVANSYSGSGGGEGGYLVAIIPNPDATYTYTIPAAANGGGAGTSGYAGGAGGTGVIIVTEHYQ